MRIGSISLLIRLRPILCRSAPSTVSSTPTTGSSCRPPFASVVPTDAARDAAGRMANSSSASATGDGSTARTPRGAMTVVVVQPARTNPIGSAGQSSGSPPAISTTTRPTAISRTSRHGANAATCFTTGPSTDEGPPLRYCCAEPWATRSSDPTGSEATRIFEIATSDFVMSNARLDRAPSFPRPYPSSTFHMGPLCERSRRSGSIPLLRRSSIGGHTT